VLPDVVKVEGPEVIECIKCKDPDHIIKGGAYCMLCDFMEKEMIEQKEQSELKKELNLPD